MTDATPTEEPTTLSKAAPLVSMRGIGVKHGRGWALSEVDFDVGEGEIVVVVGPNGAGKSTLLKVALGIRAPDRGNVTRRPDTCVSYVPQRLALDPVLPMSVERFMTLGRRERVAKDTLVETLDRVGMEPVLRRQLPDLSGGELQRVLLARALLRRPSLMVLDEPVSGVDLMGQAELYKLIGETRNELGCGVLMVSHDLYLVMAGADRVVCLNGYVCCAGRPEDVSRHPDYLALFGDRIPPAVAVYSHHHDHDCGHDHGHGHAHKHEHAQPHDSSGEGRDQDNHGTEKVS